MIVIGCDAIIMLKPRFVIFDQHQSFVIYS